MCAVIIVHVSWYQIEWIYAKRKYMRAIPFDAERLYLRDGFCLYIVCVWDEGDERELHFFVPATGNVWWCFKVLIWGEHTRSASCKSRAALVMRPIAGRSRGREMHFAEGRYCTRRTKNRRRGESEATWPLGAMCHHCARVLQCWLFWGAWYACFCVGLIRFCGRCESLDSQKAGTKIINPN